MFWGLGLDLSSVATIQPGTSPNARDRGGHVSPHGQASAPVFTVAASGPRGTPDSCTSGWQTWGGHSESGQCQACPPRARPAVATPTQDEWTDRRLASVAPAGPGGRQAPAPHRAGGHGRGAHASRSVIHSAPPGPSPAGHSSLRPQVWARALGRWPPGPGPARRGTGPARLPHRQKAPSAPPSPLPRRGSAGPPRPRDPWKPGSELPAKVGASAAAGSVGSRARAGAGFLGPEHPPCSCTPGSLLGVPAPLCGKWGDGPARPPFSQWAGEKRDSVAGHGCRN